MTAEVQNSIAFMGDAAAREEGKEIFRRIEEWAIFMMESKP